MSMHAFVYVYTMRITREISNNGIPPCKRRYLNFLWAFLWNTVLSIMSCRHLEPLSFKTKQILNGRFSREVLYSTLEIKAFRSRSAWVFMQSAIEGTQLLLQADHVKTAAVFLNFHEASEVSDTRTDVQTMQTTRDFGTTRSRQRAIKLKWFDKVQTFLER